MRFKDFTAARVVHVRSACVGYIGRFVHDSRMAGVFQAPRRIVRRRFFAEDRVFESRFFESCLPVVHTLNEVRHPFFGSGGVDVDDNRFLRFHQFATKVFLAVFLFGFETPTGDICFVLHALWVLIKVLVAHGKVTYPVVMQSRFHRFFGEQQQGTVQFVSQRSGRSGKESCQQFFQSATSSFLPLEGADSTYFDILREGFQRVDVTCVVYHAACSDVIFHTAGE